MNLTNNYRNLAGAVIKQAVADKDFQFFNTFVFDFYNQFLEYGTMIKQHFSSQKNKKSEILRNNNDFIPIYYIAYKYNKTSLQIRSFCKTLGIEIFPNKYKNGQTKFVIYKNELIKLIRYFINKDCEQ